MNLYEKFEILYQKLLSDKTKKESERVILIIAIASFLIHLTIIYLVDFGIISLNSHSDLLKNPIAAIYTPFSFILVYEVYLLVYYLPKSITNYISKQYEIITLIIIRRLFKDLSTLSLSSDWFKIKYDLQFTYDLIASVLLFFLIYLFNVKSKKRYRDEKLNEQQIEAITRFIKIKKVLATSLVPVLFLVAIYSFINWMISTIYPITNNIVSFKNINNIFFEQFFTILIIADVILLLFSFFHTDEFHKVIRNSGFIISTILLRLSFSVTGLLNTILIVAAIIFGLLILIIHNKFEAFIGTEKISADAIN
ncbi:MAG: hypothetical protein NTZ19_00095 [Bacteroidetes bacterium]|nr:hypothetical protein [Bacteroidota bacterium]